MNKYNELLSKNHDLKTHSFSYTESEIAFAIFDTLHKNDKSLGMTLRASTRHALFESLNEEITIDYQRLFSIVDEPFEVLIEGIKKDYKFLKNHYNEFGDEESKIRLERYDEIYNGLISFDIDFDRVSKPDLTTTFGMNPNERRYFEICKEKDIDLNDNEIAFLEELNQEELLNDFNDIEM